MGILEEQLDNIGEKLSEGIEKTGDMLNDVAAQAEELIGKGVKKVADVVDDVTEVDIDMIKEAGDCIGARGRNLAESITKDAQEHLEDPNSAGL